MAYTDDWQGHLRLLLVFPGLILLAFVLEQDWLGPREARRSLESRADYWREYVARYEGYAPAWLRLGIAEERNGDRAAARQAYERALQIDPSLEPAAVGLNGLLRSEQGAEAARVQLQSYLEANPGCLPCIQNMAADYFSLGQPERARSYIDQVLSRRDYRLPSVYGASDYRASALELGARIYAAVGDRDGAIALVNEALRRTPGKPSVHRLAAQLLQTRDPAAAAAHREQYRRLSKARGR